MRNRSRGDCWQYPSAKEHLEGEREQLLGNRGCDKAAKHNDRRLTRNILQDWAALRLRGPVTRTGRQPLEGSCRFG